LIHIVHFGDEVDEPTVTLAGVVGLVRPEGDREKGPWP
jgi:hypothetical protein